MSIAKISKFTDSIVVNGENTIEVQIDWEDLDLRKVIFRPK